MTTRISNGSLRKTTRNLPFTQIACIFLRIFQASNSSVIIVIDLYGSIEYYLSVLSGASDFTPFLTSTLSFSFYRGPVLEPPGWRCLYCFPRAACLCDVEKDTSVIRILSKSPRRIKFHTRRQLIPVFTPYQVRKPSWIDFPFWNLHEFVLSANSGAIFGASYNILAAGFLQCKLIC
jgi:hypothetical protein